MSILLFHLAVLVYFLFQDKFEELKQNISYSIFGELLTAPAQAFVYLKVMSTWLYVNKQKFVYFKSECLCLCLIFEFGLVPRYKH